MNNVNISLDELIKYVSTIQLITKDSGQEIGRGMMKCIRIIEPKLKLFNILIKEGR